MGAETGTTVAGRYRLEHLIAAGGQGEVWGAYDDVLGRPVAIKLLRSHLAGDQGFRRRFRAEAQAAARLSHPGVVAVYDYGEQDDVAYLVMELVHGEPLDALVCRHGRLGVGETMRVVAQVAAVLAAAHLTGLVHRDVKPANLLVQADGRVKVTDFGIARLLDHPVGQSTTTDLGAVVGTVAYMSPEQVRGTEVSPASDIYSLGVVAYQCLAGARPFVAEETIAVALAHLERPLPALPAEVPGDVASLVAAMLEKDPARRPRSAAAVADAARRLAVRAALEGDGREAAAGAAPSPVGTVPRAFFPRPRHGLAPRVAAVAAAIALALTLALALMPDGRPSPAADRVARVPALEGRAHAVAPSGPLRGGSTVRVEVAGGTRPGGIALTTAGTRSGATAGRGGGPAPVVPPSLAVELPIPPTAGSGAGGPPSGPPGRGRSRGEGAPSPGDSGRPGPGGDGHGDPPDPGAPAPGGGPGGAGGPGGGAHRAGDAGGAGGPGTPAPGAGDAGGAGGPGTPAHGAGPGGPGRPDGSSGPDGPGR